MQFDRKYHGEPMTHNSGTMLGKARQEHAALLRCEGLKHAEIGHRLGISHQGSQALVDEFKKKLTWATRRTRWKIEPLDNSR
jgi:hypothetical protein